MNEYGWVSVVALVGWLILALSSWRARQVGAKKTVILAFAWGAIFMLLTAFFTAIGK